VSIALLVITDGRDDYLTRAVGTLHHLHGPIVERWMYDDTGDDAYRARLADRFGGFRHINAGPRQGFGGAIRAAWSTLAKHSTADWVWHAEQDFILSRPVDLRAMAAVLTAHPHLAQMALRRQPWNAQEIAAGGVVEQNPGAYTDRTDGAGRSWLEHRLFFTTNPCLYRRSLLDVGWPDGGQSEGRFGLHLRDHAGLPWGVPARHVRFGFWGARTDPPWALHIGEERTGHGY
jgi:hypothetical protein